MTSSMTGYGRCQRIAGGFDITVEIKSVNHRYFEFSARTPRSMGFLDDKLKALVKSRVSRGKMEANVSVYAAEAKDIKVEIQAPLVKNYVDELRSVKGSLELKDDLGLSALLRIPDIFLVKREEKDEDALTSLVMAAAEEALAKFVDMRQMEGAKLAADMAEKLAVLEKNIQKVETLSPQTVKNYRERLYAKMREVLENANVDEQRILMEAAVFAEHVAVDEETARLKSHIIQFKSTVAEGGPVGRKLDFIVQEINREINTIGSKAQDLAVTNVVVDMKSEVEKIREQLQNLE